MLVTLRKIAAVGAVAFLAALGGTATASAQPSAPHASGWSTFQNQATGRCIDDSDFGFRTNACNGSIYQKWTPIGSSGHSHQFQNQFTGRCIDDSDFGFRTNECNLSPYQMWFPYQTGGGYTLQNQFTGRCIDDSDFRFRTNVCNFTEYQTFFEG
ncbi:RICIN domain-containing protein [Amycolatopsis vancoresmycina]|uniref:Ricin B lectin n=1 Tax=Amycolatopsis vancoresmycina DSM 44592 TaxID=1292037 RepID=R1G4U8_9PSEU|nr:RICIN domain-containing protein [Amycolatopsis vancoresmycina]EOD66467.1 Ricin B lectin [Amycolatopsis vancoresmycina DSM 44592]